MNSYTSNNNIIQSDDRSYDNSFIDWCKPINEIELTMRGLHVLMI